MEASPCGSEPTAMAPQCSFEAAGSSSPEVREVELCASCACEVNSDAHACALCSIVVYCSDACKMSHWSAHFDEWHANDAWIGTNAGYNSGEGEGQSCAAVEDDSDAAEPARKRVRTALNGNHCHRLTAAAEAEAALADAAREGLVLERSSNTSGFRGVYPVSRGTYKMEFINPLCGTRVSERTQTVERAALLRARVLRDPAVFLADQEARRAAAAAAARERERQQQQRQQQHQEKMRQRQRQEKEKKEKEARKASDPVHVACQLALAEAEAAAGGHPPDPKLARAIMDAVRQCFEAEALAEETRGLPRGRQSGPRSDPRLLAAAKARASAHKLCMQVPQPWPPSLAALSRRCANAAHARRDETAAMGAPPPPPPPPPRPAAAPPRRWRASNTVCGVPAMLEREPGTIHLLGDRLQWTADGAWTTLADDGAWTLEDAVGSRFVSVPFVDVAKVQQNHQREPGEPGGRARLRLVLSSARGRAKLTFEIIGDPQSGGAAAPHWEIGEIGDAFARRDALRDALQQRIAAISAREMPVVGAAAASACAHSVLAPDAAADSASGSACLPAEGELTATLVETVLRATSDLGALGLAEYEAHPPDAIRRRFRELARKLHPDKVGLRCEGVPTDKPPRHDVADYNAAFRRVREAYDRLSELG